MHVLSCHYAKDLADAFLLQEKECVTSLNLGMTQSTVKIDRDCFVFPDGNELTLADIKSIKSDEKVCYMIEENAIFKVQFFAEDSRKFYKLMPTKKGQPPTLEISGIRMHMMKTVTTSESTQRVIKHITPVQGNVLDTCCGLGYTATAALKHGAKKVDTFEIDPNCTTICTYNPWSQEIFGDAIELHKGDVGKEVEFLKDEYYDRVIHDPPRLAMATYLYSLKFYKELFRVMKSGGILYHYTGAPGSKKRNVDLPANTMRRLRNAGFTDIEPAHYGVVAKKP